MGFWIFLFLSDLLIPITMLAAGKYFLNGGPKEINGIIGYRTSMSMMNKDTWKFAHQYCGKLWYRFGLLLLPVTVIAMLCVLGKTEDEVGTVGGVVCFLQMIPLVGSIIPTEKALRRTFDKDGNRKQE